MSLPPDKPSARSMERMHALGPFPPELVPEYIGINQYVIFLYLFSSAQSFWHLFYWSIWQGQYTLRKYSGNVLELAGKNNKGISMSVLYTFTK